MVFKMGKKSRVVFYSVITIGSQISHTGKSIKTKARQFSEHLPKQ